MVLLRERVHPWGLSLAVQRKVYIRRTVHKEAWQTIAKQVKNLKGEEPYWQVCRDTFKRITQGSRQQDYSNCGRHAAITPQLRKWLVSRLHALRQKTICTSVVLQRELARHKRVKVEASTVRHHLRLAGYKYLTRGKKRKYTRAQLAERKQLADWVSGMTPAQVKQQFQFSMDGVVMTVAPQGPEQRQNYLRTDDAMVWRRPSEVNLPELAGHDSYNKQVPKNRMVPLWGGISWGGFGLVIQHEDRKVTAEEWAEAVDDGCMVKALRVANPARKRGPWRVLCDNESFLRAPESVAAHRRANIQLIKIPAKSPDLNPVELFWAWLRKQMRAMDLNDLAKKRQAVGKTAYKARLLRVIKTPKAQQVAANTMKHFMKVCKAVSKAKGAATSAA